MQGVRQIPTHGQHQEPVRGGFEGYLVLAYKLANISFRRFFPTGEDLTQAARLVALEAYNELGDNQIMNMVHCQRCFSPYPATKEAASASLH